MRSDKIQNCRPTKRDLKTQEEAEEERCFRRGRGRLQACRAPAAPTRMETTAQEEAEKEAETFPGKCAEQTGEENDAPVKRNPGETQEKELEARQKDSEETHPVGNIKN